MLLKINKKILQVSELFRQFLDSVENIALKRFGIFLKDFLLFLHKKSCKTPS